MDIDTSSLEIPLDVQESWQKSLDLIAKIANIPAALVMRVHHEEIEVFTTSNSIGNPYKQGEMASLGTGLYCETVLKTRQRLLIPNALVDPFWNMNPDIKLNMISYVGFPIIWPNGDAFGTICLLDSKENAFTDEQSDLLFQFKTLVEFSLGLIYEHVKLDNEIHHTKKLEDERRTLKNLATIDSLTGLYNRRAFVDLSTQLFLSLEKEQGSVSVFVIDLDNFKTINDRYGHLVGDKALRHVSDTLAELSRRVDILSRYGGDEFVLVAPVESHEVALTIAERLIVTLRNTPLIMENDKLFLTISVGVCFVDPCAVKLEEALHMADLTLLEAKKNGRDQFLLHR